MVLLKALALEFDMGPIPVKPKNKENSRKKRYSLAMEI